MDPAAHRTAHLAEHGLQHRGYISDVHAVEIRGGVYRVSVEEIIPADAKRGDSVDVISGDDTHLVVVQRAGQAQCSHSVSGHLGGIRSQSHHKAGVAFPRRGDDGMTCGETGYSEVLSEKFVEDAKIELYKID